ncbi:MAG: hypothetical protein LBU22_07935 [Dysgonamonadaceae bacterium]|jgi:hypothetical protein|nr:hypothetical protein [Dysgonamonadaceae bacterium]
MKQTFYTYAQEDEKGIAGQACNDGSFRMKQYIVFILFIFGWNMLSAQNVGLNYYLPQSAGYDKKIPTPESVLGYQVGDWHASHEQIVNYIKAVDAASDRVKLLQYGYSHEQRPLYLLIISSPENQKNLEQIKTEHLKLSDPSVSGTVNTSNLPIFTWLGHSIHGNEASGANAAILLIYHLAAAKDAETLKWLNESVIFVDPVINPDGFSRFTEWVNSHKSFIPNDDTQEIEHSEAWPGGRGNHYWFDLNRDWLNLQQPESQARISALIEWRPNVYADAHEQGTNANYHFSPGEPTRVHPLIPDQAQDFIKKLAEEYYAPAFDKQGLLYFSAENYDDYYPGRGREYLDFHGGIAILWEQPSSRGFVQASSNGTLTFQLAIRNQLTAGLATIRGSHVLKKDLLDYQKWYFKQASDDARNDKVKAYIFGSPTDKAAVYRLAEIVKRNNIEIYKLAKDFEADGKKYSAQSSYVVPLNQSQHRLVHALFEIREEYKDSLSYDITGWTIPFAFNLDYSILGVANYNASLLGEKFEFNQWPQGKFTGNKNAYAYLFEWDGYYAPRALYRLLDAGIFVKVSEDVFTAEGRKFSRGTILIPLGTVYQQKSIDEIYKIIDTINKEDAIDVYSISSGFTSGHNLGSSSFGTVVKPRIAVLATGSAGEVWHLFDQRYRIPVSLIENISRINLNLYNVLILPGASSLSAAEAEKLRDWVDAGNTLIGFEGAISTFVQARLANVESVRSANNYRGTYEGFGIASRAEGIAGVIFKTQVDLTHPLLWGYSNRNLPVFKNSSLIVKPLSNSSSTPVVYAAKPLLSGNVLPRVAESLANTPVVLGFRSGQGRIIAYTVNPNFRGIWYGTNKLTANAVFFGNRINAATLTAPTFFSPENGNPAATGNAPQGRGGRDE